MIRDAMKTNPFLKSRSIVDLQHCVGFRCTAVCNTSLFKVLFASVVITSRLFFFFSFLRVLEKWGHPGRKKSVWQKHMVILSQDFDLLGN